MASRQAAAARAAVNGVAPHDRSLMVWRRAFCGVPEQAHDARRFIDMLLADFSGRNDVVQAGGELIANALTHTRSGAGDGLYVVELRRRRDCVALAVVDQGGATEPRLGDGGLAESGYGLLTVKALASWWGWSGTERGRTVTAVFARHSS